MNWDAIGAVGEVIGALAVVISLAYVGVQVRLNTVSQNGLMHQQLVDSQNDANRMLIENVEFVDLLDRANTDFESLASKDRDRLLWMYISMMNLWTVAYANHRRGLLEKYVLDEWDRGYANFFASNSGLRRVWDQYRNLSEPSFQKHVEGAMQDHQKSSPPSSLETDA